MTKEEYINQIGKNILKSLPTKVKNKDIKKLRDREQFRVFGLQYLDVREKDFSEVDLDYFSYMFNYNNDTIFPERCKLPKGFKIEKTKGNIRTKKINLEKITNEKFSLAIVDNPLKTPLHNFYMKKDIEYVLFQNKKDETHFHIQGILSNLFFNYKLRNTHLIVYTHGWGKRGEDNLKALKDVEKRIKDGEIIKAVSFSDNLLNEKMIKADIILKLKKQIERLKSLGCEVIDSMVFGEVCSTYFIDPYHRENVPTFKSNKNFNKFKGKKVFVKCSPVYTDFINPKGYVRDFWPGMSWGIPQFALIYSYFKVKYKDLTMDIFKENFAQSYTIDKNRLKIFDYRKLFRSLKNLLK